MVHPFQAWLDRHHGHHHLLDNCSPCPSSSPKKALRDIPNGSLAHVSTSKSLPAPTSKTSINNPIPQPDSSPHPPRLRQTPRKPTHRLLDRPGSHPPLPRTKLAAFRLRFPTLSNSPRRPRRRHHEADNFLAQRKQLELRGRTIRSRTHSRNQWI